jgi:hypothetical protein
MNVYFFMDIITHGSDLLFPPVAVPASIVAAISPETIATLTGTTWFPTTQAFAFMPSLRISFYIGALLSIFAAILSAMSRTQYVHEFQVSPKDKTGVSPGPVDDH